MPQSAALFQPPWVESRCGAVAVGSAYLFPPLSSGGASLAGPWLRFHIPLVALDVRISRIQRSDEVSCLRPRKVTRTHRQPLQPQDIVEVLVREARSSLTRPFVFLA